MWTILNCWLEADDDHLLDGIKLNNDQLLCQTAKQENKFSKIKSSTRSHKQDGQSEPLLVDVAFLTTLQKYLLFLNFQDFFFWIKFISSLLLKWHSDTKSLHGESPEDTTRLLFNLCLLEADQIYLQAFLN